MAECFQSDGLCGNLNMDIATQLHTPFLGRFQTF